jgi:hypothetical protein
MSTAESTPKPKKAQRKGKNKESAEVESPSPNGAAPAGKKKRAELTEQLRYELRELRTTLDELIDHYRLRVGGQIAELEQSLTEVTDPAAKLPPVKVSNHILTRLHDQSFKPKKGRAKDLVKLQELVKELSELLPPET